MNVTALRTAECHIWWADPQNHHLDDMVGVLDPTELRRAAGYRREEDRQRFVTAAWLLRTAAGAQLDMAPERVPIERRCMSCDKPHGRPYVLTDDGLHASISHSAHRVAVALTTAGEVGVDVEQVPTAPVSELVGCALSKGEQDLLKTLPERHQQAGFARMWVCKEAVLKATGHGLRISPHRVEVSGPREEPALLSWPLDIPPRRVHLRTIYPGDGYAGVVAVIGDVPIRVSEWDASDLRSTAPLLMAA
ncbi:4'-phosphopantetheinyl transferase [Sphaerisporangium melleum]|jgi:4'-phosphopantetheinyl transferase|uniref:4'-phosphopantetheinyl transferase n=1 Tax=Sphaerisporangium melleum TaxID=321316 RepID=A0A917R540_9ACTN|nr:4'-phosphopantetheinyl transferase superfamily protein [Sphaerisporangium melleum]GGK90730.1 4'-phosphopantetheinyl transferase [Sphaerisporangium melleum]GII72826.1 4'-phosphopantetheinyl transferase [Sphaerisporangium melleum]